MAETVLDIRGLSHAYGDRQALRDVSFSVRSGALFGLLGPNGGGKTTLFRVLSTLIAPAQGRALVAGFDTAAQPGRVRQALGVVFQHVALDADLTVLENLRFHSALYSVTAATFRTRADELLRFFELEDRAHDRVKSLSGGLQRRVDLVRALLHRPQILLLDEPTTGLDPAARRTFWHALAALRQAEGTTMLVATHLMDEAEACDEVAVIDRGRLVAAGTPSALKKEVGGETLWLETDRPDELKEAVAVRFGLSATASDRGVQIAHAEAHTLLGPLYSALGDRIVSATVRKPTLEDVFFLRTGHHFEWSEPLDDSNAHAELPEAAPIPAVTPAE